MFAFLKRAVFLSAICLSAGAMAQESAPLSALGRGIAVVFSPDLSVESNCAVYERLGFVCYQTASWEHVVEDIRCRNASSQHPISMVILETHGTNGNGLKLQEGKAADALRSYAAIGALEERFGSAGVQYCILSACNSRRLFRPAIYYTLDPGSDRLFLPATLGIMNAGNQKSSSGVRFLTRADSHVESLSLANTQELTADTRRALGLPAEPIPFVVSDLLIQMLTNDPTLDLRIATPVEKLEHSTPEDAVADLLFSRFVARLHEVATSDETATQTALFEAVDRR